MLYVIGLGLYDEKDITVRFALGPLSLESYLGSSASEALDIPVATRCRGLEAVKRCRRVFLEAYTSMLMVPKEQLVRVGWRTPTVLGMLT